MSKLDAKSLARIRFRLTSLLTVLSARLMTERTFHLPTVEKTEKLLRRAENAISRRSRMAQYIPLAVGYIGNAATGVRYKEISLGNTCPAWLSFPADSVTLKS